MADNRDNVVGMIRERTEESDLEQCLKASMGGYTKKSVVEYIALLKKQQQSMTDTFNANLQQLLSEKEKLAQDNELLTAKLQKTDTDYRALSEAIVSYQVEDSDFTLDDVMTFKHTIEALQTEIQKKDNESALRQQEFSQQSALLAEREKDIARLQEESKVCRQMLSQEKSESARLRTQISSLSGNEERLRQQILHLNQTISEGNVAQLNAAAEEARVMLTQQNALLEDSARQLKERNATLVQLQQQNDDIRKNMAALTETIDRLTTQNEKLSAYNDSLLEQLKEAAQRAAQLIQDKCSAQVDRLQLARRLDRLSLDQTLHGVEAAALPIQEGDETNGQ